MRGLLRGILIECSYSDAQPEETLFGHLKPWFLIEELKVLAEEVTAVRKLNEVGETEKDKEKGKKRKRYGNGVFNDDDVTAGENGRRRSSRTHHATTSTSTAAVTDGIMSSPPLPIEIPHASTIEPDLLSPRSLAEENSVVIRTLPSEPLKGLKVVVIHVKDRLDDGVPARDIILKELKEYEEEAGLGCEFVIVSKGQSVFL